MLLKGTGIRNRVSAGFSFGWARPSRRFVNKRRANGIPDRGPRRRGCWDTPGRCRPVHAWPTLLAHADPTGNADARISTVREEFISRAPAE